MHISSKANGLRFWDKDRHEREVSSASVRASISIFSNFRSRRIQAKGKGTQSKGVSHKRDGYHCSETIAKAKGKGRMSNGKRRRINLGTDFPNHPLGVRLEGRIEVDELPQAWHVQSEEISNQDSHQVDDSSGLRQRPRLDIKFVAHAPKCRTSTGAN
ncbi:hypothetical protein BKA80DRAFT_116445 [Phyllosticta citrichinensis]